MTTTYENMHPKTQAPTEKRPFCCRSARRDRIMTKTSGSKSEGRKRTKAPGEIVLAWMERWTSLVNVNETNIVEKQKGTSVANMIALQWMRENRIKK